MAEVDIIELWNKGKKHSLTDEQPNIDEWITKTSKTPLYWIKVVLWVEFWLNLVSLPIVYIFREDDPILYGIITPILIFIYLVYYQFLIQKIKAFDYTVDVKTGLRKLYGYLNFFFLHYKVVIWVLLPISYAYGIYIALAENPGDGSTMFWLKLFGIGIGLCALVCILLNTLINLIYGRKIKRLRGIFMEMELGDQV